MLLVALSIYAIIAIVLLTVYGIFSFRKGKRSGRLLAGAFWLCAVLLVFLLAALYHPRLSTREVCYSWGFAICGWVFYFLLISFKEAAENEKKRAYLVVMKIWLVINTAILVTNPINHFGVKYNEVKFYDTYFLQPIMEAFFMSVSFTHLLLLILLLANILSVILKLSSYYRTRYYPLLASTATIAFVGLISSKTSSGLADPALLVTVIALFIFYYVLFNYSQNSLLGKIQPFINDNVADATVVYDNTGKLLGENRWATDIIDENTRKSISKMKDFLDYPEPNREKTCEIGDNIYSVLYKPVYDKKNVLIAEIFVFHDITEMERRIEREHRIAVTDPLTGAYNRKGFFEIANDFLYRNESEAGFALMISGILNFKSINSSYGAKTGDTVLKTIERKFHNYHHSYPMIYGRTAEGKFTALIPFDYVEEVAADMSCIRIPVSGDADIHVDLCHGFVVLDDISKPLDYYYERALIALSECKKKATEVTLEYSYDMEEKISRQQVLLSEMHNAINDGQFFIELQPQINLSDRSVCGAEALVRWKHPRLGRISPGEFIPLFEENGFISNLDVFVWESAAKALKKFEEEGVYDGSISVNVSQIDISSMDVVSVFERIVKETGINRKKLHIEITESACANKRETLVYTMEKLRENGFILEIDDFGSGYSSLNALMHLPFDVVKLDMEFMKENNMEGKNGIIIDSIVYMIHNIGASIIVEGVETEKNVENMVHFGGDVAQGYYFSRPLSLEAFREYALAHKK